jgi:cytosine/adenosine deaminase-related metal-dependent hydrolase
VAPALADVRLAIGAGGAAVTGPAEPGSPLLAMPAPVNAHDHGYGVRTLDFGCPDDALEPWIAGWYGRPRVDPALETLVAFGRLALAGCGATMHCQNSFRLERLADDVAGVLGAARQCGIRLALSCPLLDHSPWIYGPLGELRAVAPDMDWSAFEARVPAYAPAAAQIEAVSDIIGRHGDVIQFGPIGPQWCSDAMLEGIAEASERLGARIHMHLLESPRQRRWLDERFADGVVKHLDRIGFLSPRLAVAHGVRLRPDECELLAERGVIIVSNPSANLRLRSGIAPVAAFRRAGLRYAIGLDGTGFGDDQDFWQEMRLFRLLHSGDGIDPEITAGELFGAVYENGAAVLGLPAGRDWVTIDYGALSGEAICDDVDETERILTRMSARHVRDLFVAGRRIVADGGLVTFDFEAARAELTAKARHSAGELAAERRFSRELAEAVRRYYRARE